MARLKVIDTADPTADPGPGVRAALRFPAQFQTEGDAPGPVYVDAPDVDSGTLRRWVEEDLDSGLPDWNARLSILIAED